MDGTGYSVQATSTAPFSGVVADFTPANPNADLSQYTATITWSDPGIQDWFSLSNSPSAGVIAPDGNGGFTVSTTAKFANSGLYHFVVTITDNSTGAAAAPEVGVAYGQIIVNTPFEWLPVFLADAPTGAAATISGAASNPVLSEHAKAISTPFKYYSGQTFSGDVGAYSGIASASTNLTNLKGTIHWGDGTTSPATFAGGKKGYVVIRGSHTYAKPGTYATSVDVTQTLSVNGKPSALYPLVLTAVDSTAKIVAPAANTSIVTGGIAIDVTAGATFTEPVASFTAPAAATGVVRVATIYWGDGAHSTGKISTSSANQLTVTGSHDYKKTGKYTAWVYVTQVSTRATATTKVPKILAVIKTTAEVSTAKV
jgi:hypothetical protein